MTAKVRVAEWKGWAAISPDEVRGRDNQILLAVTGGIASGKSAVARMLEELGAPGIDFDALSRVVVEPDKPAWREVVGFFGKEVVQEDRTLDRKKISEIVFREAAKRGKLEEIIHPRVYDEFVARIKKYAAQDEIRIIQVIVPLLFEVSLQHLFHKVLLVYIPRELQVERLVKRDRISRARAAEILAAQWPIDQKKELADYIVDNSGSLEDTERQVKEIWKRLQGMLKEKPAK